jgi:WD40 repeat protein
MKKKLFYLGLAIAFYFSLFTTPCFAQGDTAWIHDTGLNGTRCVRISPDGQYVAAGFESGTISLYTAESGSFIRTFPNIVKRPYIRFSPDGQWLVGGGEDSLIYIWDVASGTLTKTYSISPETSTITTPVVGNLDVSPNGNYLLASSCTYCGGFSYPSILKIWNLQNDSLVLNTGGNMVTQLMFSPNNQHFVIENSYRNDKNKTWHNILIWRMDSLKVDTNFKDLPWWVADFVWSSTGDTLAVASGDSLLYFIDVPQKSFVDTLHLFYNNWPLSTIKYFNNYIITGGGIFSIMVWVFIM